jgi:secreted PhoX family phosphatase
VRLPSGFTSRILARSSEVVEGTRHVWHAAPDGGVVFPQPDGWIYVSNAEISGGNGGVGALRFSSEGAIVDAYSILSGTSRNCAGGPTPWGTWLSCEEVASGQVWECDPTGRSAGIAHPAMGIFNHEAVAVDPVEEKLYLTEDESDGRLYRFTPARYPDLSAGTMEVLRVIDGPEGATEWLPLPDPSAQSGPTRLQVPESTSFAGGEGIWFHEGVIYFATKGDDRIWAFDPL